MWLPSGLYFNKQRFFSNNFGRSAEQLCVDTNSLMGNKGQEVPNYCTNFQLSPKVAFQTSSSGDCFFVSCLYMGRGSKPDKLAHSVLDWINLVWEVFELWTKGTHGYLCKVVHSLWHASLHKHGAKRGTLFCELVLISY